MTWYQYIGHDTIWYKGKSSRPYPSPLSPFHLVCPNTLKWLSKVFVDHFHALNQSICWAFYLDYNCLLLSVHVYFHHSIVHHVSGSCRQCYNKSIQRAQIFDKAAHWHHTEWIRIGESAIQWSSFANKYSQTVIVRSNTRRAHISTKPWSLYGSPQKIQSLVPVTTLDPFIEFHAVRS